MTDPIISIRGLTKIYKGGHQALKSVDLDIHRGEIFALLGPNGAGKTTLIGIICGTVQKSGGTVTVAGADLDREWRAARRRIGLVPQEISTDIFERVWQAVRFSRGLFGKAPDDAYLEQLLKDLSLWDKRTSQIQTLSGGMKRRVLIAKALAHEPDIVFLDEPTAGVDVELRRDMWAMVRSLRERGVTIILTTHYIEEAEDMADRVGVIAGGALLLVDDKAAIMDRMGKKQVTLELSEPLAAVPGALAQWAPTLSDDGRRLTYEFDARADRIGVASLLAAMRDAGIGFTDIDTRKSSLEEIFVDLVHGANGRANEQAAEAQP